MKAPVQVNPLRARRGEEVRIHTRNSDSAEDLPARPQVPPDVHVSIQEASEQKRQADELCQKQAVEPAHRQFASGHLNRMRWYRDHWQPDSP